VGLLERDQLADLWSHLADSTAGKPEKVTAARTLELMTEFPREENHGKCLECEVLLMKSQL